jgi:hypothetical protein
MNTARTSTRKLEKLKPPSKSIATSSFTILVPIACGQFIRPAMPTDIALWCMGAI